MEQNNKSEFFNSAQEKKSIRKVREDLGLPSIIDGFVTCLCCDQSFFSEDTKKIRICHDCKDRNSKKEDDNFAEF